jgi:hypothetical protein
MKAAGTSVDNYIRPTDFSVNAFTGLLTWDSKFKDGFSRAGEYSFAARIAQYDHDGDYLGYTMIDFQVILNDAYDQPPLADNLDPDENDSLYLAEGTTRTIRIFAEKNKIDNVTFRDSTILRNTKQFPEVYSFAAYDSTQGSRKIHVGVITLTGLPNVVRDNPYAIVIRTTYSYFDPNSRDKVYMIYTKEDTESNLPVAIESGRETLKPYPNPVANMLHVDWTGVRSISIYSSGGSLIHESVTPAESIDMSSQAAGVYVLRYELTNHRNEFVKFIKY